MAGAQDQTGDRAAVLVGVGTAQRPVTGYEGAPVEAIDLMVEAAAAALGDAGGSATVLRDALAMVAVPEGNWTYPDPARLVADRLGAGTARTVRVDIGVPQCTPIRVAVERIRRGEIDAALVVGGEAKATQLRVSRAGGVPPGTAQDGVEPDERWRPEGELMAEPEITAGIWDPVAQYACIDNALRAAEGRTLGEHLDEIAGLWADFNRVARGNPSAAFGEARTAGFLRAAGEGNRPLAFPYAKWHSTQWAVDQAGALVLCDVDTARRAGIDESQWLYPRALVESSDAVSLTKRSAPHRWPAMRVLGEAVRDHLGRELSSLELVELYSCFPAAVRVQQRELGLPLDVAPTITGGMAFAGGPFNNFTYQATAAMARRLRGEPGTLGLVSTVSGLLTKPGLAVWSTEPGPGEPLLADLAGSARAATATCEVTGDAQGDARVVTYTITYDGGAPASAFVVAALKDGRRWIGTSADADLLDRGVGRGAELIGAPVRVEGATCRLV